MDANWEMIYPNCEWSSSDIEHPFNEEEIKATVFGLGAEKAPGPIGFPILFFQTFWDPVKTDILHLFGQFYNRGVNLRSLN